MSKEKDTIEAQAKQLIMDYKCTFASPEGGRVLKDLSKFCLENRTCYQKGDSHHTTYNTGARSIIIRIRTIMNQDTVRPRETQTINESN